MPGKIQCADIQMEHGQTHMETDKNAEKEANKRAKGTKKKTQKGANKEAKKRANNAGQDCGANNATSNDGRRGGHWSWLHWQSNSLTTKVANVARGGEIEGLQIHHFYLEEPIRLT
jgi:hypothetical protein